MKMKDVKAGMQVRVDGGFTCMKEGIQTVECDGGGLFLKCDDGHHYIEGQEDEDGADLVGISEA